MAQQPHHAGETRAASQPSSDLLHEDDEVRIWRLTLPPGTSMPAASDPACTYWLCVLEGGRVLMSTPGQSVWELNYDRGQSAYVRPDDSEPRTLTNRGNRQLRFLRIELKP